MIGEIAEALRDTFVEMHVDLSRLDEPGYLEKVSRRASEVMTERGIFKRLEEYEP